MWFERDTFQIEKCLCCLLFSSQVFLPAAGWSGVFTQSRHCSQRYPSMFCFLINVIWIIMWENNEKNGILCSASCTLCDFLVEYGRACTGIPARQTLGVRWYLSCEWLDFHVFFHTDVDGLGHVPLLHNPLPKGYPLWSHSNSANLCHDLAAGQTKDIKALTNG